MISLLTCDFQANFFEIVDDVIKVSIDTMFHYVSHFVQFNSIVIQMIFVHDCCSNCSWGQCKGPIELPKQTKATRSHFALHHKTYTEYIS